MKSIFLETMGDYPINRVMDFLVNFEDFDYSLTDIAKFSKVGYATLQLFWKDLEMKGIVVKTRSVGRAKMYRLNKENPAVQHFIKMYWALVNKENMKYLKKEKVLAIAKK